MFSKNTKKIRFDKVDTLIGKNTSLIGKIIGEGTVRIDGKLDGDVSIKGDLVLGESGEINGNVEANNVHVCGKVRGNVIAKSQLRLTDTAKLYGDTEVASFVLDDGAIFEGNSKMIIQQVQSKGYKQNTKPSIHEEEKTS